MLMKKTLALLLTLILLTSAPVFAYANTSSANNQNTTANSSSAKFQKQTISVEKASIYEKASINSNKLVAPKKGWSFTPVGSTKSFWKVEFRLKGQDEKVVGYVLKTDAGLSGVNPTNANSNSSQSFNEFERERLIRYIEEAEKWLEKSKNENIIESIKYFENEINKAKEKLAQLNT